MMAIGVLEKLSRMGIDVPSKISVIGCDNSPAGELTNPKLTTIDYKPFEAGRSSGQLLIDLINGGPVRSLVFPPKLVVRESTK